MLHALHGAVCAPSDFHQFAPHLPGLVAHPLWQHLRVWREAITLTGWARRFCETVVDDESPPRALLGYSMGARLGLHALLTGKRLWKAAVIVSAHPGLSDAEEAEERIGADLRWGQLFQHGEWVRALDEWNAQPVLRASVVPDSARGELLAWRPEIVRSFTAWSLGRQQNLRAQLSEIPVPVLWLTGARDAKFTSLAEECVPLLPHGRHVVIEGAGHRVLWDAPGAAIPVIREFLTEHGAL